MFLPEILNRLSKLRSLEEFAELKVCDALHSNKIFKASNESVVAEHVCHFKKIHTRLELNWFLLSELR